MVEPSGQWVRIFCQWSFYLRDKVGQVYWWDLFSTLFCIKKRIVAWNIGSVRFEFLIFINCRRMSMGSIPLAKLLLACFRPFESMSPFVSFQRTTCRKWWASPSTGRSRRWCSWTTPTRTCRWVNTQVNECDNNECVIKKLMLGLLVCFQFYPLLSPLI